MGATHSCVLGVPQSALEGEHVQFPSHDVITEARAAFSLWDYNEKFREWESPSSTSSGPNTHYVSEGRVAETTNRRDQQSPKSVRPTPESTLLSLLL